MYNVSFPKVANSPAFKGIVVGPVKEKSPDEKLVDKIVALVKEKYPHSLTGKEKYWNNEDSKTCNYKYHIHGETKEIEDSIVQTILAAGLKELTLFIYPWTKSLNRATSEHLVLLNPRDNSCPDNYDLWG